MVIFQLLANGLVTGCAYALVALGFALIYNTTRIFHLAHGAVYAVGAYLFYSFYVLWSVQLVGAALLTVGLSTALGVLIDEMVHIPLDQRESSMLIHLLSSLGLYIAIVNVISMFYGNGTKVLITGAQPTYSVGEVTLTRVQVATVLVAVLLFLGLVILLRKTRLGQQLRAMRDDPELVSVMGLNPRKLRRVVFGLGSALASVAAVLLGLDTGIDPRIGLAAVLNGAVAVIIGGIGLFEGAALGAVSLGLLQSIAIWQMSSQWQEAVTFGVLILFLLFRPQGILGTKRRVEEVVA
jgi:branched-subunit amino acid ABC-type transport system permease component